MWTFVLGAVTGIVLLYIFILLEITRGMRS